MKFNDTFLKILSADLATGRIVPALMGEPGIGKTSFVKDLAKHLNTEVFVIQANQLSEKADLTGVRTVPTPDGKSYMQVFFPHQTIHDINEYALSHPDETPILDLDEINRTDSDVTSALLSLSTERTCGNTKLADNIRIIVTGNDKGNVTVLDSASLSRFSIYTMQADADVFLDLMGNELNSHIRNVLEEKPEYIFIKPGNINETYTANVAADDDDDNAEDSFDVSIFNDEPMIQFTTPRTIEGLSKWLNNVDNDFLRELVGSTDDDNVNMLHATIISHTGDTAFSAAVARSILNELDKNAAPAAANNVIAAPSAPACYSRLITAKTTDELEDMLSHLPATEKEELFIYLMCENNVPSNISYTLLRILGTQMTTISTKTLRSQFVQLIAAGYVKQANVDILDSIKAPIHTEMAAFFSFIG